MQINAEWLALGSFIVAVTGLLWQHFGVISSIKERLTSVETKMELFWNPLMEYMSKALHHPTQLKRDKFIDNFEKLSLEELTEMKMDFKKELADLIEQDVKDPKVLLYSLFLARIDQKIHDTINSICNNKMSVIKRIINKLV